MNDYFKFRGKCKELAEQEIINDPSLILVRGFYFCPIWNTEEQHWWCVDKNDNIIDPSSKQFPSNGLGIYTEFNDIVKCDNCQKEVNESDAIFESRYAFCSSKCLLQFVGII